MNIKNLTAGQIVALSSIVTESATKKAKAAIIEESGEDSMLTVESFAILIEEASIKIGTAGTRAPTSKLLSLPVLALLVHRLGATREGAMKAMAAILAETGDKSRKDTEAYVAKLCPEAWAAMLEIEAMAKQGTPTKVSPRVTVKVEGEIMVRKADVAEEAA